MTYCISKFAGIAAAFFGMSDEHAMPFSESIRSWLPSCNDGFLKDININVRMIPISSGDVRGVFSRETRKTR